MSATNLQNIVPPLPSPHQGFRVYSARAQHRPGAHELSQHGRFDTVAAGHGTLISVERTAKCHLCCVGRHSHRGDYRLGRAGLARQHAGGHARQQAACTRLQASGPGSAGAHHVQWALGGRVCGRDEQMEVRQFLPLHADTLCRACVSRLRVQLPKPGGILALYSTSGSCCGVVTLPLNDGAATIDEQGENAVGC